MSMLVDWIRRCRFNKYDILLKNHKNMNFLELLVKLRCYVFKRFFLYFYFYLICRNFFITKPIKKGLFWNFTSVAMVTPTAVMFLHFCFTSVYFVCQFRRRSYDWRISAYGYMGQDYRTKADWQAPPPPVSRLKIFFCILLVCTRFYKRDWVPKVINS